MIRNPLARIRANWPWLVVAAVAAAAVASALW
jgi:hypothetical protein